jgi:hypothetical protein
MMWLIRSALCALYPRTDELPGLSDCHVSDFLTKMRGEAPFMMWSGLLLGTLVFHATPLLTVFIPLPAFLLPRGLRDTHAYRLTTTRLYLVRQTTLILKLVAGLCWGADPRVRANLGLPELEPDPDEWRAR